MSSEDEAVKWLRAQITEDGQKAARRLRRASSDAFRWQTVEKLARAKAELAILDEHAPEFTDYIDGDGIERGSWECGTCEPPGTPDNYPCKTVRLLASGYRRKGGYEEEWGS